MARAAAGGRGYSRLVRWMKVLLPVAALLTVGAIFLFGRESGTGEALLSAEDLAALGAGLRLEEPQFTGRTAAGEPYRVTAAWAEPDGALPDRIRLANPAGEIETADGMRISGRAETGVLHRGESRLELAGAVRLETDRGHVFESARLAVALAARRARSPGPVTITGAEGRLEAGRMRISGGAEGANAARIFFEDGVRVVFIPRAGR